MSDHVFGESHYTECFLAFVDALGFRTFVNKSEGQPEKIAVLVKALTRIGGGIPVSTHLKAQNDEESQYGTHVLQVRPFSDCVCLFVPVATNRLPYLLRSVRYIHDRMLELGVCIRGAITVGGMHWDRSWGSTVPELHRKLRDHLFLMFGQQPPRDESENSPDPSVLYETDVTSFPITLGPALVTAEKLEREYAHNPRVIASDEFAHWLEEHGSESAFPLAKSQHPIKAFFRTLANDDGRQFFDVLHPDIVRNDTERIVQTTEADGRTTIHWERSTRGCADVMADIDRLIEKTLSCAGCADDVRLKYEWLKSYVAEVRAEHSSA